ncbi:MAG: pseudouridine-5'-phosphate glycosidase [Gemmatimonadales bacterium]
MRIHADVRRALERREPVVALESSVLAQGLPIPHNRSAAERMGSAIGKSGALPAITAVVRGAPAVGLDEEELERFLRRDGVAKVSARDVPWAMVRGLDGATTVAASLMLAAGAGVEVFATGGIGGVHFEPAFDESADLAELARRSMVVVCSGAKSILDLAATWERLESLGVPVVGYRTDELPGFYTAQTGIALTARANEAGQIVELFRAHRALGRPQALLVVQPPPAEHALEREEVDEAVARARGDAARRGIRGAAVTPFLLAAIGKITSGASLETNLALLERNARLAGEIARAASPR